MANAAWAVEDRVVWGAADLFRAVVDVVKWPFQRIAWAIEHWLVWPIQEETALWSRPVRAAVLAGVVLLAAGGLAAGIALSSPSSGGDSSSEGIVEIAPQAATPAVTPPDAVSDKAAVAAAAAGPVLKGSTEIVPSEHGGGVTKAQAATEPPAAVNAADPAAGKATATADGAVKAESTGAAGAAKGDVAGPDAIAVARRFSGAFVLYETGHDTAKVKSVFHETATPDLARALIKRPPRLPANVKVPQAKVVNIVAGPKHGDTYTVSVSMLRVGVTSELRLDMKKTPSGKTAGGGSSTEGNSSDSSKRSKWLVTDVLG